MRTAYIPGMLAFATVIACTRPDGATPHSGTARAASEQYRVALNASDSAAFFSLLHEDLELFPPAASPLKGVAAHDVFRGLLSNFVPTLEPLVQEEWIVEGPLAVQRYSFRLRLQPKSGGRPTTESGSGLHVWQRGSDGRWRLAKDIWSAVPAAADSI